MSPADRRLFLEQLNTTRLKLFQDELLNQLDDKYTNPEHGNFNDWQHVIESLPEITPSVIDLGQDAPVIGNSNDCAPEVRNSLKEILKALCPWRKGPFDVFGIHIDSEWRSDWKWSRIEPHVKDIKDKLVLDIGCSNGYYALRMQAMGAKLVIGIDPTWLYVFQFLALQKYLKNQQCVFVLPFTLKELPRGLTGFDIVFSMGVLYHHKEPQSHLKQIQELLTEEGQLVLETLIIDDKDTGALTPNGRYANMRNVWIIPSYAQLERWLKESGFVNITLVDLTKTSIKEQRQTEWMTGYSLANALDPKDSSLTIEGYPAPIRASVVAEKSV